jgi:hypothetical protein
MHSSKNHQNYSNRITLQSIINYVDEMQKMQVRLQEIETAVRGEGFQLLYFGRSKNLTDLPDNLKLLMAGISKDIVRTGIITKTPDPSQTNLTFFMSLLFCLDIEYLDLSLDAIDKEVSELKSNLTYNMKNSKPFELFKLFKYNELKWKKKTIIDDIVCNRVKNKQVIKYIMDYFNINLLILDINEDALITCYPEETYDPFKNTIVMTLFDEVYEPVCNIHKSRLWKYKDNDYKILLQNMTNNKHILSVVDFSIKNREEKEFAVQSTPMSTLMSYLNNSAALGVKYHLAVSGSSIVTELGNKSNKCARLPNNATTTATTATTTTATITTAISVAEQSCEQASQSSQSQIQSNHYGEIICESTLDDNTSENTNADADADADADTNRDVDADIDIDRPILIKQESKNECSDDDADDEYINDTTITVSTLKKMKLSDLMKEAERVNVVPTLKNGKYKTKNQLIIEINDYYKLHNTNSLLSH